MGGCCEQDKGTDKGKYWVTLLQGSEDGTDTASMGETVRIVLSIWSENLKFKKYHL